MFSSAGMSKGEGVREGGIRKKRKGKKGFSQNKQKIEGRGDQT